jgi:serine/threonine protein kinase
VNLGSFTTILIFSALPVSSYAVNSVTTREFNCVLDILREEIPFTEESKRKVEDSIDRAANLNRWVIHPNKYAQAHYQTKDDPLGGGLMAEVFEGVMPDGNTLGRRSVTDLAPNSAVVLKIPYPAKASKNSVQEEAYFLERIRQNDLHHRFVRGFWDPKANALVTEFVPGGQSMYGWKRGSFKADVEKVKKWKLELNEVREVLRKTGIVHSDLHEENILVTPDGDLKIIDFSISADEGKYPKHLGGNRFGNSRTSSKNQLAGNAALHADDLYSLAPLEKYFNHFIAIKGKWQPYELQFGRP